MVICIHMLYVYICYMYTYVICIHMLYVYICHHHIYVHSFVCAKCNIYIYIYIWYIYIHDNMFYVYICFMYIYICIHIYIYIYTFVHVDLETKPSHLFVFDATHTVFFVNAQEKGCFFLFVFFAQDICFNRAHVDVLICFDFILLINVVSPINLNPNHHTFL